MKKKLASGSIKLTKMDALHSAIAMIPAVFVVMSGNIVGGAALAIGILPTSKMGIPPKRKQRVVFGFLGCLFGLSVFVGAHVIQLGIWQASLILFTISFFAAISASRKPAGALLLALIIPALGVGMGYGTDKVINVALLFIVGSLWSAFVSLFFPEFDSDPDAVKAQKAWQPNSPKFYGFMLGLAGAAAIILGSAFDPDHLGWIMAATLLIMRPLAQMTGVRGISRAVFTMIGTILAVIVLRINPALIIMAIFKITKTISFQ